MRRSKPPQDISGSAPSEPYAHAAGEEHDYGETQEQGDYHKDGPQDASAAVLGMCEAVYVLLCGYVVVDDLGIYRIQGGLPRHPVLG